MTKRTTREQLELIAELLASHEMGLFAEMVGDVAKSIPDYQDFAKEWKEYNE